MALITTFKNGSPVTRKTNDPVVAVERAVKSNYGNSAEWFENNSTSSETRKFGQVGKPCSSGGYNMITDVIYIDVDQA